MKKYSIGSKVSLSIGGLRYTGKITDVLEISHNDNVYVLSTEVGNFHLNNNGELIF